MQLLGPADHTPSGRVRLFSQSANYAAFVRQDVRRNDGQTYALSAKPSRRCRRKYVLFGIVLSDKRGGRALGAGRPAAQSADTGILPETSKLDGRTPFDLLDQTGQRKIDEFVCGGRRRIPCAPSLRFVSQCESCVNYSTGRVINASETDRPVGFQLPAVISGRFLRLAHCQANLNKSNDRIKPAK